MSEIRIMVLQEKHHRRYINATSDEQLHAAALMVVQERAPDWYTGNDLAQAIDALMRRDGPLAVDILKRRTECEYEGVTYHLVIEPLE